MSQFAKPSAAFTLCASGGELDETGFGMALAVCGALKYGSVPGMKPAKRLEGFLANLVGSKDEHAVIGAASV